MILSDRSLKKMIAERELIVEPLTDSSIQPASIDCRLGSHFLIVDNFNMSTIDMDNEILYREFEGDVITLPPPHVLVGHHRRVDQATQ